MEKKTRVALLGVDAKLLFDTKERINKTRPVEVTFYTDLKDFLENNIESRPDMVGISLNFPHPNITQFPRVFKMALDVPVITFGESEDPQTRKKLSASKAEYKISGKLTAHNLWMKIINCQKDQEQAQKEKKQKESGDGPKKSKNSVFLKGEKSEAHKQDKGTMLSSLFAALDSGSNEEGSQSKLNIVTSGSATEFKKEAPQMFNKDFDIQEYKDEPEESSLDRGKAQIQKGASNLDHFDMSSDDGKATTGLNAEAESFSNKTSSLDENKGKANKDKNSLSLNGLESGSSLPKDKTDTPQVFNKDFDPMEYRDEDDSQKKNTGKSLQKKESLKENNGNDKQSNEDKNNPQAEENKKQESNKQKRKKEELELENRQYKKAENQQEPLAQKEKQKAGAKEKPNEKEKKQLEKEEELLKKQKNKETTEGKEPLSKNKENRPESAERTKKEDKKAKNSPFGAVKIADEKEFKAKELERKKLSQEKSEQKKQDALQESCELALGKVFFANKLTEVRPFDTESINVFTIESGPYKGFLLLANSFNHQEEPHVLEEFRATVIENMKKNGLSIEMSSSYVIKASVHDYNERTLEFSDFLVDFEEETGKQQVASFVKREAIKPKLEESDKEGMYLVDIKVIPPKTLVNFDAFLYLPKNKKFVRYLKEGRCLSLEQAKRHTEVLKNNKLYLPKEHKQKFFQFFIQNTIDWELAIISKTPKPKAS